MDGRELLGRFNDDVMSDDFSALFVCSCLSCGSGFCEKMRVELM